MATPSVPGALSGKVRRQVTLVAFIAWPLWLGYRQGRSKPRGRKRALSPASRRENHKRVVDVVRLARHLMGEDSGGLPGNAG
jgi:hypothetical protein